MALSDEQILDVVQPHLPQYGHSEIWKTEPEYAQCVGIEEGARWTVSELRPKHTIAAARAIEAEVRKQDEALIRQLVDALETVDGAMPFPVARQVLKVARARLGGKP